MNARSLLSNLWPRRVEAVADVDWPGQFEELLPYLYNYFRYRTSNDAASEDLTSETLERAWRYRGSYRGTGDGVEVWVMAIARNVAIDHGSGQSEVSAQHAVASPLNAPSSTESERILREVHVGELLAELPERERELIALKYGASLTNRDIATVTGMSESNVGTVLHRTIKRLRHDLGEDDE